MGSGVLRNVTLGVRPGRFVAVMGPPRSGKSALLNVIAGMVKPTSGSVRWGTGEKPEAAFVGPVEELPRQARVREVVEQRGPHADASVLSRVYHGAGLWWSRRRRVAALSAAARQRLAVAREAATAPALLLAPHEPGSGAVREVNALSAGLRGIVDSCRLTAVMVTDDPVAAARADSVIFLRRGEIVDMAAGADPGLIHACLTRINRLA
ncbi:ATP-binding cassette domain-containing protein [Streptomyces sp. NPDC019937]|uniref:ATP-binding cassette domain-containing protein n=1 Tax=Streptomyces sp. NPDC019937 TaxID=3154787 RepID=UPI0033E0A8F9